MKPLISEKARTLLVQSVSAVEAQRFRLQQALSDSLARDEVPVAPDVKAALLLSFLTRQVKELVEGRPPRDLDLYLTEHRLNGIDGRHYSRFGDALVPTLRDALGPSHPRETASAWCDAFWAVVQRMHEAGSADLPVLVAEPAD